MRTPLRRWRQDRSNGRAAWPERITRRIHEVFDSRLKSAGEHFQRDSNHAHGHATLLTNALLGIRKKMILLARLAALPTLPDMVKQSLQQSLQQFAGTDPEFT